MTDKEIIEEMKKLVSAFGSVKRLVDGDKWVTIAQVKKEDVEQIEKSLEVLENIKSKTLLPYSNRKRIAKEYEKWCEDNNVMISDPTNMVTWLLCIKLKEWLENEKDN